MSDRRLTPANGRVAAAHLKGTVVADRFVEGELRNVSVPVADILSVPEGPRDRQILFGHRVRVFEERRGYAFVQCERDGYVGYIQMAQLSEGGPATHWVTAPSTTIYLAPDIKKPDVGWLSFGSCVSIISTHGKFLETDAGFYVPKSHFLPTCQKLRDPAGLAAGFLGTPYLWGGNSRIGIDCSGLVQAVMQACGVDCPADSDLQEKTLGKSVTADGPVCRGDLLFWKGHVAIAVDSDTLIHANATDMAVVYEPIKDAVNRIEAQGEGPLTSHKRL